MVFSIVNHPILGFSLFLETPSLHLKMDVSHRIVSFWGPAYFQGRTAVSFRECRGWKNYPGMFRDDFVSHEIRFLMNKPI